MCPPLFLKLWSMIEFTYWPEDFKICCTTVPAMIRLCTWRYRSRVNRLAFAAPFGKLPMLKNAVTTVTWSSRCRNSKSIGWLNNISTPEHRHTSDMLHSYLNETNTAVTWTSSRAMARKVEHQNKTLFRLIVKDVNSYYIDMFKSMNFNLQTYCEDLTCRFEYLKLAKSYFHLQRVLFWSPGTTCDNYQISDTTVQPSKAAAIEAAPRGGHRSDDGQPSSKRLGSVTGKQRAKNTAVSSYKIITHSITKIGSTYATTAYFCLHDNNRAPADTAWSRIRSTGISGIPTVRPN